MHTVIFLLPRTWQPEPQATSPSWGPSPPCPPGYPASTPWSTSATSRPPPRRSSPSCGGSWARAGLAHPIQGGYSVSRSCLRCPYGTFSNTSLPCNCDDAWCQWESQNHLFTVWGWFQRGKQPNRCTAAHLVLPGVRLLPPPHLVCLTLHVPVSSCCRHSSLWRWSNLASVHLEGGQTAQSCLYVWLFDQNDACINACLSRSVCRLGVDW